jgi:uncharacterized protein YecE (DUF72 family)
MATAVSPVRVGTAGWSIPRANSNQFAAGESVLIRYGSQFNAVEINSSFYRPHRGSTYARWAACVPDGFSFAIKAPRQATHERRLVDAAELLMSFREGIDHLGDKLGVVLFQLPPSLSFDDRVAGRFFGAWREMCDAPTVCEPRNPGWFSAAAVTRLAEAEIAYVIADPPVFDEPPQAMSLAGCAYYRLHGSPVMYESAYGPGRLDWLARHLIGSVAARPTWCIFDNTKFGAATSDALALTEILEGRGRGGP